MANIIDLKYGNALEIQLEEDYYVNRATLLKPWLGVGGVFFNGLQTLNSGRKSRIQYWEETVKDLLMNGRTYWWFSKTVNCGVYPILWKDLQGTPAPAGSQGYVYNYLPANSSYTSDVIIRFTLTNVSGVFLARDIELFARDFFLDDINVDHLFLPSLSGNPPATLNGSPVVVSPPVKVTTKSLPGPTSVSKPIQNPFYSKDRGW